MSLYGKFSKVYDLFMENDHDKWTSFILKIWQNHNKEQELVLDLCCGTGIITNMLSKKGYDMIGIDSSSDMLLIAKERASKEDHDILYLNQDIREFELYGTVSSVLCLSDGFNYILDIKELQQVFKLVKNYLDPKGLFIFDINTKYKFEHILSDNNFSDILDNSAYIWENYYDDIEKINEYIINFFVEDPKTGFYERFQEEHFQKAYEISEVKSLLNSLGFKILGIYDDYTFKEIADNSERAVFVCEKAV